MITSVSNAKVRQLAAWQEKSRERRRDGIFVAEGIKMFREAPANLVREVYVDEALIRKLEDSADAEDKELLQKLKQAGAEVMSSECMKKVSDTQTPQGVITVLDRPEYDTEALLSTPNGLFVILEDLQDPGNLGTILRTGEGAGITAVIMSKGTVDIYNPKVIRSTMGSVYRVPFWYADSLEEVLDRMHRNGIRTYAAHLKGETYYDSFDFKGGTAFLIGNEGNGLRKETADLAGSYLKIPMEGKLESLNAAVSAALLMYEAHRQRS